jgi:nucleoredoxin
MHDADVLMRKKFDYKKAYKMLEKELSSYKYTGNDLQQLLSREATAVLTYGYNSGKDTKLMKQGIDLMKKAVAVSPNTGEAEKLRGYIKIQSRCLAGSTKVTEIQEKLKDSSIKGVERAKLLDQLLKAMRAASTFNKPLRWSQKEPYVKEIIALDAQNKAGLKKFYGKDIIERDIFKATELHHYEDVYNNLDKLLKEYGITDPVERQALVMRKARAMMLLNRSRNDVISVLKQAYRLSPNSKEAAKIRKYAKALHNPESKVKLIGFFGPELVLADGKKVEISYLNGNSFIGVYSSAHWCGPCKRFTPRLVRFRDASQKTDNKFEVVFRSSDRSEEEMFGYMKGSRMKWPAIPYGASEGAFIKKVFAIGGIPDLIVMTGDGTLITMDGRRDVAGVGSKTFAKWNAAAARKAAAK